MPFQPHLKRANHVYDDVARRIPPMNGQQIVINDVLSKIQSGVQLMQLTGLPLVGKSYLAQQVAAQLSQNALETRWSDGDRTLKVHTVSLKPQMVSIQLIRQALLESFGCTEAWETSNDPPRFWRFVKSIQDTHVIILNNADAVTGSGHLRDEFLDLCIYLCHASEKLRILITTRLVCSFVREPDSFQSIEVLPLSVEDSRCLFRSIAGDLGLWEHQLVPLCAGIPYVITSVARALRDKVCTADEMFSNLKSVGLCSYATNHGGLGALSDMYAEIEKCIARLSDMCLLRISCVALAYIPGTFDPEAAAFITGSSVVEAKHDVIDPLRAISVVMRGDHECDRFQIHTFVRSLLEERHGLLKSEVCLIRNRFCTFFAQLLQKIAPLADQSRGRNFHLVTQELTNLEKLLQQAVYLMDDHYELFFDIAYNAEYHIINLMPKNETVLFYEWLMNTASRINPYHYGVLLSSFGQVSQYEYKFLHPK